MELRTLSVQYWRRPLPSKGGAQSSPLRSPLGDPRKVIGTPERGACAERITLETVGLDGSLGEPSLTVRNAETKPRTVADHDLLGVHGKTRSVGHPPWETGEGVIMSQEQEKSWLGEIEDLDSTQGDQSLEELLPSPSSFPMVDNLEEYLDDETPSDSLGLEDEDSSIIPASLTSSNRSNDGSISEEEEDIPGTSEILAFIMSVCKELLSMKVDFLVNFLLTKYKNQEFITKEEMLNVVLQEYSDFFPEILTRATEYLELLFGLDLKEVDPVNNIYVILIKLGLTYDGLLSEVEGMPKTGLLILILSVIFMKGNRATEEEVWEVLGVTGIYPEENHFIFGNPKNLITKDLVQEQYLEYQQVPNSDPPQFVFLWGPRAHAETTKMRILEFVAKAQKTDPRFFPSQYEEAWRDEEERAQARVAAILGGLHMYRANYRILTRSISFP
ncbi:PREDICTED: melanoma-associated antigen B16-like [Elephantulus edwardii]|uniref:melanoma-associated antigen B16-like n=1 Tax=Elephantulus edwardii TaxID=28737 RepID=UPI0003F0E9A4|nr:PREDICTED: melanoma-associated antigen B16-like [Elephantulus edwardii]